MKQSGAFTDSPHLQNAIIKDWQTQLLLFSQKYAIELWSTSTGSESGRRIITPQMAAAAVSVQAASEAKESERLAEEAALLSIQSSEKSIKASKVAIVGGAVAIAAACTVM